MLLTSSGSVHGPQPADVAHVPDDFRGAPEPTDTAAAVGHSKRAAEFLIAAYGKSTGSSDDCPVLLLRRAAPAARHPLRDRQLHPRCAPGRPIEVRGDGTPRRSYLYSADLVIWLLTILCKGARPRLNVGSEEEVAIADLARRVAGLAPAPVDVHAGGRPPGYRRPDRYAVELRARAELGLRQTDRPRRGDRAHFRGPYEPPKNS